MSLPKYGEYVESNVPWLGKVPSHWHVHQTKRHFRRRKDLNAGMVCDYRLALTMNGVVPRSLEDLDGLQSSDYEGYQIFEPGDLVFKLIDLQNIKTSRVGLVPERGIMSPAYIRLEPLSTTHKRYAYWYFMALYWTQVFNSLGGGVRQTLGPEELLTVEYPVPSRSEQAGIAAFLDRETAKIDALIAEQEKLIVLLAEKRQATICHAATKGLNPNSSMKDSDVAWMGEVPAHWNIAKLGLYATVENGTTPSRAAPEYWDGGDIPWLASGEVNQLKITEASEFITEAALKNCSLRLLPAGTVVVGMIGQGKTRGMSAILRIPATINQNLAAICPGSRIEGMYILYLLHAVYEWLREAGRGGNQAAMNCEILAALRIPLPPLTEQRVIVDFIELEAAKLDSLKAHAEQAIALLKERRTGLIAAAVTGQIDVRTAVSQRAAGPEAIAA